MPRTLIRTLAIAALSLLSTAAMIPATDMLIQIKGANGATIASTKVADDGSFKFETVPAGSYTLELVIDGKPVVSAGAGPALTFEVKTAREASSGLATGKRQYAPAIFRRDFGRGGPIISGRVDGQTISGKVINNSHSNIK